MRKLGLFVKLELSESVCRDDEGGFVSADIDFYGKRLAHIGNDCLGNGKGSGNLHSVSFALSFIKAKGKCTVIADENTRKHGAFGVEAEQ